MKNTIYVLRLFMAFTFITTVMFLVSCAQQAELPTQQPAQPSGQPSAQPSTQPIVMTRQTELGLIMVDSDGMTLYDFRADSEGESSCYGQCATAWPPLLIEQGQMPTGTGITAELGTAQRTDGTIQVTANGMPLYYFFRDSEPGDVNGQGSTGAGALWYVLDPSGEEITARLPKPGEDIIKTEETELGTVLTGPNGMSLYDFRADRQGGESSCYGQCAHFWPPLLIEQGQTPIGTGITAELGTTQRTDGTTQVTADGWPLYYYIGDSIPGDVNGQGSTGGGALWYLLDPDGDEITVRMPLSSAQAVATENTSLGQVMVGDQSMTLYIFEADTAGQSTCYGQCADAWPPFLIDEGIQPQGTGVTAMLSTVQRDDGTFQVTADGAPLYYYIRDSKPGDTLGQAVEGFGAKWYALTASGIVINEEDGEPDARFSFFITSQGPGIGADLGGLSGADSHCQDLASAVGFGDKTWKAYLSTTGTGSVDARDRIGSGPWYNYDGVLIAGSISELHADNNIDKQTALTEMGRQVNGRGDTPNRHDILTGSDMQGRAIDSTDDTTCSNWMSSSSQGSAMTGHHDRLGLSDDEASRSWVTSHLSRGCSQENLRSTGGDGLFYCFAVD